MFHIEILDLIAGLIFIYFLMSLICNSVFEAVSSVFRTRAVLLKKWIKKTFSEQGVQHFLTNKVLDGLSDDGKATYYIDASNFTTSLIDYIYKQSGSSDSATHDLKSIEETLKKLPGNANFPSEIKNALLLYISKARAEAETDKEQIKGFITHVERWYDSMMDRVGSVYKRKAMLGTLLIATTATLWINVDTLSLVKYLYTNKDATAKLAQAAYAATADTSYQHQVANISANQAVQTEDADSSNLDADDDNEAQALATSEAQVKNIQTQAVNIKKINTLLGGYIPLGWGNGEFSTYMISKHGPDYAKNYKPCWIDIPKAWFLVSKAPGWALTILAVMLGAPFWYDLLNKVANLRNSIKPLTTDQKKNPK